MAAEASAHLEADVAEGHLELVGSEDSEASIW